MSETRRPIHEWQRRMYRNNEWTCPAPDTCTAFWSDDSWIRWIDSRGLWHSTGKGNFRRLPRKELDHFDAGFKGCPECGEPNVSLDEDQPNPHRCGSR